jgi:UDP-N-acetyl-D-glucosamine dehydrogenase
VRESPVSELRNQLIAQGAVVAWHDPLVPIWEGTKSVEIGWECDLVILATKQPGMDVKAITAKGIQILDCTNSLLNEPGVISL